MGKTLKFIKYEDDEETYHFQKKRAKSNFQKLREQRENRLDEYDNEHVDIADHTHRSNQARYNWKLHRNTIEQGMDKYQKRRDRHNHTDEE